MDMDQDRSRHSPSIIAPCAVWQRNGTLLQVWCNKFDPPCQRHHLAITRCSYSQNNEAIQKNQLIFRMPPLSLNNCLYSVRNISDKLYNISLSIACHASCAALITAHKVSSESSAASNSGCNSYILAFIRAHECSIGFKSDENGGQSINITAQLI
jgi:hypothetical protein